MFVSSLFIDTVFLEMETLCCTRTQSGPTLLSTSSLVNLIYNECQSNTLITVVFLCINGGSVCHDHFRLFYCMLQPAHEMSSCIRSETYIHCNIVLQFIIRQVCKSKSRSLKLM